MNEHPGKEVGCSDKQWMGEGVPLFYSKWKKPVLVGICPTVYSLKLVRVSWSRSFRSNNEFCEWKCHQSKLNFVKQSKAELPPAVFK